MRVLFPFVGDSLGGSHRSSLILVDELNKKNGIEAFVLIHQRGGILEGYLRANNFRYLVAPWVLPSGGLGKLSSVFQLLILTMPLVRIIRRNDIDIVHTNDGRMHLIWALATRLSGARFIWHQRTPCTNYAKAVLSKLSHSVLTISQYCASSFPPMMQRRCRVVYNPSRSCTSSKSVSARASLVSELHLEEGVVVVSWVANFQAQKRPLDFIRFAGRLRATLDKDTVFLMFGEIREPLGSRVRELILEEGLGDFVILMGAKWPIEPYIQASDMLVATAEAEGHGRTLLEAMCLRTPVIASGDGGHLEIIQDGVDGWLFPVGDIDAIANAAVEIVNAPAEAKIRVDTALKKVQERFSLQQHVNRVLNIYRHVGSLGLE